MNVKRFIAVAMAATMVCGNSVTAFAVEGTGSVEYDNSVAITYDSFTLPTLYDEKYNFTLDPRDELYSFDHTTYAREGANPGIYFHSEKTAAKIERLADDADSDLDVDLYTLSKDAVADDAADWKAVVTAVADDDAKTPTVTSGYYVWIPAEFASTDSQNGTTATGKKGAYLALTKDNIKTYFDIKEKDAQDKYEITMKEDHLAGDCVCDGKLYKDTYTELTTAITDNKYAASNAVDLNDYVTQKYNATSKEYEIDEVKNVYVEDTENGGYVLADKDNIKFTPAVAAYQALTDKVIMTNKSTKDKVVTAVVTMSNISGLTFNDDDDFDGVDTASVFFKATNGSSGDDKVLSVAEGATTATATFTAEVAGAEVSPIKYQGGINDKTGGHNYFNYEAVGTDYNSSSFWIEAKANTEEDAADAWKAYGKALEEAWDAANAETTEQTRVSVKPSINIVYTVKNVPTAEEAAAEAATEAANGFKTTYADVLELTTSTVAYEDLDDINAALTAFEALSEAAQANLTTEKALLDELKTAAEAKAITDETGSLLYITSVSAWYVGTSSSAGISDSTFEIASITMQKDDGTPVDISSAAEVTAFSNTYWISIPYASIKDDLPYASGSTYTVVATVGNTRYTAVYGN